MPRVSVGTAAPDLRRRGASAPAVRAVLADRVVVAVAGLTVLAALLRFYRLGLCAIGVTTAAGAAFDRNLQRPDWRVVARTIVRLDSSAPVRLTPASVSRALRTTNFANDELLWQR